jgi:hypothetical protein
MSALLLHSRVRHRREPLPVDPSRMTCAKLCLSSDLLASNAGQHGDHSRWFGGLGYGCLTLRYCPQIEVESQHERRGGVILVHVILLGPVKQKNPQASSHSSAYVFHRVALTFRFPPSGYWGSKRGFYFGEEGMGREFYVVDLAPHTAGRRLRKAQLFSNSEKEVEFRLSVPWREPERFAW